MVQIGNDHEIHEFQRAAAVVAGFYLVLDIRSVLHNMTVSFIAYSRLEVTGSD